MKTIASTVLILYFIAVTLTRLMYPRWREGTKIWPAVRPRKLTLAHVPSTDNTLGPSGTGELREKSFKLVGLLPTAVM